MIGLVERDMLVSNFNFDRLDSCNDKVKVEMDKLVSNFQSNRLESIYLSNCVRYCFCDIIAMVANMIFSTQ